MGKRTSIKEVTAVVLTVGLCTALNMLIVGYLIAALTGSDAIDHGLSENFTQVLTGTFGGIIGVLGSFLGFKAGTQSERDQNEAHRNGKVGTVEVDRVEVGGIGRDSTLGEHTD